MINIYEPNIKDYSSSAIDAINSGWISNHGIYIMKSTNKLKDILNIKYSILVANGTCATHCLFLSLKYKYPNIKKIYVPNNCYVAAWNCLLMEYPKKVMEIMKMDINTWNIDTSDEYIKNLDINSAVLIVHNLGNIINVPRLKRLRPDLIFLEDNCEGLFGKYENIYSGTSESSLCSSISFYGNKIITTGEGGAFLTNNEDIYNYILKVYSQGMSEERYIHDTHAYNYRMTNIQAAFLFDQLNDLDNILTKKENIFNNYKILLSNLIKDNKVQLFVNENNTISTNWIFGLRIKDNKLSIKETNDFFKDNNIDIRPFFYPITTHQHLSDLIYNDDIPHKLNNEIIMIPSSPNISIEQQHIVIDYIEKFIFYVENNIKIIEINENNNFYLKEFISEITSDTFRYYQKRDITIIKNHLLTIILLNNENKICGYAHIDNEDNKYWFGIYIYEKYQNKGLGNKIMKYIFNYLKIKNINEIYLTVDNINTNAIKLYKKNNFNEILKNDKFILMNKYLI